MPVVPPLGAAKPVDAAAYNRLRKAAIQDPTPATPARGQVAWDDVTGSLLVYYGATTGWQKPWWQPWGEVGGPITNGTGTQVVTTLTDVTGMSLAFTTLANRYYRVTGTLHVTSAGTGDQWDLIITDASNAAYPGAFQRSEVPSAAGRIISATAIGYANPAAGSVTFKMRAQRANGANAITAQFGSIAAVLVVEDIGNSGNAPTS